MIKHGNLVGIDLCSKHPNMRTWHIAKRAATTVLIYGNQKIKAASAFLFDEASSLCHTSAGCFLSCAALPFQPSFAIA